LYNFLK